jgi:formylglycine-generating enzyme
MVLVDGAYCPKLQVQCLKQWHAPQNHLHVCEKVKKPTVCAGPTRQLRFCIDRYEFPNKKGERPMVMQNFYQAQVHCAKRGKRICTESEWTKACQGPENKPFPYGYVRDPKKCQGDQRWDFPNKQKLLRRDPKELERLWQGVVSGSQPECISDYGVHDLPGNADELAASESYGKGPKSDFDNVTTGGPWYKGVRNMCHPKIYSHDESFAYYYLSWRCCKEADGKATDPRTPKQIRRKVKFERIIWQANHSWKLPFNPRVPGEKGYTPAGPGRSPVQPKAPFPNSRRTAR